MAFAAVMLVLAGCQLGGDRKGTDVAAPSAIQGPVVEVTSLVPADAPQPNAESAANPAPDTPVAAPQPKSPSQIVCEKRGGAYVTWGRSQTKTCQLPTRDGGKQCRKESDCDGVCLARSRTCAPAKPLFGCQSILQENGVQADLCID